MNNIDHLATVSHSAGKPWVLAFTWTPVWQAPLTQTPLQNKSGRSWQRRSSKKKCSGRTRGTWQRAHSVKLASEFPRPQINWTSSGCTTSWERSMGAPTWTGLGSGASHRCWTDRAVKCFTHQEKCCISSPLPKTHSEPALVSLRVLRPRCLSVSASDPPSGPTAAEAY